MTGTNAYLDALPAGLKARLKFLAPQESLFHLNAGAAVFIAVDMQNFVCAAEPERAFPGIKDVIERINLLADLCHGHGLPVIWLRHCFTQKGGADDVGLYRLFHRESLDPGLFNHGQASEIHPLMHCDQERDFVVEKNRYSALAPGSSRLETLLASMGRTQLILGGAATNVCVESTARDAMQRGYQVTVLSDATTTFDPLVHQMSLVNLRCFFGDIKPVAEVIRELEDSLGAQSGKV